MMLYIIFSAYLEEEEDQADNLTGEPIVEKHLVIYKQKADDHAYHHQVLYEEQPLVDDFCAPVSAQHN